MEPAHTAIVCVVLIIFAPGRGGGSTSASRGTDHSVFCASQARLVGPCCDAGGLLVRPTWASGVERLDMEVWSTL